LKSFDIGYDTISFVTSSSLLELNLNQKNVPLHQSGQLLTLGKPLINEFLE
jgi:hypothetical protein